MKIAGVLASRWPASLKNRKEPSCILKWAKIRIYVCVCGDTKMSFFVGLAYQGKNIVFRFIIEYSSLMDFGPLCNNNNNRSIFI
jgi:hypothetical protein